jgi:putative glycerol-1-phosphate prenyltransferase
MFKGNNNVFDRMRERKGQIAVLIDPEKVELGAAFDALIQQVENAGVSFIFVGGSTVTHEQQQICLARLRQITRLPLVIFPGCPEQIDQQADALLFLNLISGRNPDYLIENQILAVPRLMKSSLEIIPTAYILIDGGKETMVQKISKTQAISQDNEQLAIHTALAGVLMGNQVIYLDAGSGALKSVPESWISKINEVTDRPIIVGGGVRSTTQIKRFFDAGANLVVIGNHVESNPEFLMEIESVLQLARP